MFPKNCWYVACTPDEFVAKPLGRQICGTHLVFYRNDQDKVVALEDFCPHRGAPLSLGYVEDGDLVCGYHGLKMGANGKTKSMPKQRVGGFPCVKNYPVEERYGFVWIWMGDASKATSDAIPLLEWADNDEWAYGGGLYHINCDHKLMIDNLMDLSHETYVHSTSIGQKEIDEAPVRTKKIGSEILTSRHMDNVSAPPFWQANLRFKGLPDDQPVDRWQICRFTPPSSVHIEVGVALAGHGGHEAPFDKRVNGIVVDFMTPETATSHWYFWGMARNFKADDTQLTDTIREGQGNIFNEDMEMLERQQQNLLLYPQKKLLSLDIDSGGVQARRIIDALIQQENSTADTPS